jgi:hypothetical protein
MSTTEMMERIAEALPRIKARIAGVFCLLTILEQISRLRIQFDIQEES